MARKMIAEPLLEGESARSIAFALNEAGHRTRSGALWASSKIARLATSPLWAGLLPDYERILDEYGNPADDWKRGGVYLDQNGKHVIVGEGVITPGERARIQAHMAKRRHPGGRGKRPPEYLLHGILRCGRCGSIMEGAGGRSQGGRYQCQTRDQRGPAVCRGIVTSVRRLEDAVLAMWRSHVSALGPDDPALRNIAQRWLTHDDPEKEARRKELAALLETASARMKKLEHDHYVLGRLSESRYEELREQQGATISALQDEAEVLGRKADLTILFEAGEELTEAWEASSQEDKRALLACAFERVVIAPPKHQGDKSPIIDRLTPVWVTAG